MMGAGETVPRVLNFGADSAGQRIVVLWSLTPNVAGSILQRRIPATYCIGGRARLRPEGGPLETHPTIRTAGEAGGRPIAMGVEARPWSVMRAEP